jgi:SsrA-binding protein
MPTLVSNKKIGRDFTISDEMVAGLVLSGGEVKSLKAGQGSLNGAYVSIRGGEAWLVKAYITPYKYAAQNLSYNPDRDRKLLLKKAEIMSLVGAERGTTIVPLNIFTAGHGLVKLRIGIGRGKKKYDKRESIKKRDVERRIRRVVR